MSQDVTILDQTDFVDRTDPSKPVDKVLVTFQLPDGRVSSVVVERAGFTADKRNAAIREALKGMGPSKVERVRI